MPVKCINHERYLKSDSPARPTPLEDLELIMSSLNSPWGEGGGTSGDVWPEPFCILLTLCFSVSAQHIAVFCRSPWISFACGKWEPNEQAGHSLAKFLC